jgi:hypothetical protein
MQKRLAIVGISLAITGILLYFLGSISLFEGAVLSHYGGHLRYFGVAYVVNLIFEFWGVGLLISGIVLSVYASGVFNVQRKGKIALMAIGAAALVIGASLSGIAINGSFPPPEKMDVLELRTSSTLYEINATPPYIYFSVCSLYMANISLTYFHSGAVITYSESSFSGYFNSSALPPIVNFTGVMSVVLSLQSGGGTETKSVNVTVVPELRVLNITGPQCVNDSSAPVLASYHPVFVGGIAPFNFTWSIGAFYIGNVQNVTTSPLNGSVFNVTYFENPISNYSYGYNASIDITLTITDSVGMTSSYQNGSDFFSSYFVVNVIGD